MNGNLLKRRNNAEISDYTYRAEIHGTASSGKVIISRVMMFDQKCGSFCLKIRRIRRFWLQRFQFSAAIIYQLSEIVIFEDGAHIAIYGPI